MMLGGLRERFWRIRHVRKGWSSGIPPGRCTDCEAEGSMMPAAYSTGDGWWLHWYCDECGTPDEFAGEIPWPMKRNWANTKDLGRLGFEVV